MSIETLRSQMEREILDALNGEDWDISAGDFVVEIIGGDQSEVQTSQELVLLPKEQKKFINTQRSS